jgi:uncharacterized protein
LKDPLGVRHGVILAGLFLFGLIAVAFKWWLMIGAIAVLLAGLYAVNAKTRFMNALFIAFLMSFILFQLLNTWIADTGIQDDWRIILNRLSLILIVTALYITHLLYKQPVSFFQQKPNWSGHLKLPGHAVPIFHFWFIGIIVNVAIYVPLIVRQGTETITSLLLFAFLFSLINAVLEEMIWRGPLFSSLMRHTSLPYALIVTSMGFGLLHLAIGIPLTISLLFSAAGLFYGYIVYKTNSIYPAILFHFVLNIGMVLSGWILS